MSGSLTSLDGGGGTDGGVYLATDLPEDNTVVGLFARLSLDFVHIWCKKLDLLISSSKHRIIRLVSE